MEAGMEKFSLSDLKEDLNKKLGGFMRKE